jgi:Tryptophan-associated transmembrane protein (Trp_oprn_chp)
MTPERSRTFALGGLLTGAALSFLAGAQPWWRARGEGLDVAFSGTTSTGGVSQTLALVTAAGTTLLLTLGPRGRRIVAVILIAAGLAMAVLGALPKQPTAQAVQDQVRTVSLIDQFWLSATIWPAVYAAAGILITVAAMITALWSGRWPRRAGRFQVRSSNVAGPVGDQSAEAWVALDAGLDPTADFSPAAAQRRHPDVQSQPPQDTMGDTKPSAESQRSAE